MEGYLVFLIHGYLIWQLLLLAPDSEACHKLTGEAGDSWNLVSSSTIKIQFEFLVFILTDQWRESLLLLGINLLLLNVQMFFH